MMIKPIFSVITVTLNNIDGLIKTHTSLNAQNFENYEWIVIDGKSIDRTLEFLKTTDAHSISEKDSGIYDAMNKGIERATGDYLIFMNAGDIFASVETLQTISETITAESPDFIYGDALEIFEGVDVYKRSRDIFFLPQGMITHHQSMVYNRQALKNLRYDLNYKIASDYDLTWRFTTDLTKISYISTPLCLFESGGVSERQAFKGRIEQFKIRRKNKIDLWLCIKIFTLQSVVHSLRKISPRTYWRLKNFATRL